MDTHLPRSLRRLLVMSGFAAANHRLDTQAEAIRQALPLLVSGSVRTECEVVMQALLDNAKLTSADYNPMLNIASQFGYQPGKGDKS